MLFRSPNRRLEESLERFGEISLKREYFSGFSASRVKQSRHFFITHISKLHIHDFVTKTIGKIKRKKLHDNDAI